MTTKKVQEWAEIALRPDKIRFDCLSQFLQDSGVPNRVEYFEVKTEDQLVTIVEQLKKTKDQIRIGPPYGPVIGSSVIQNTSISLSLKTADALLKQEQEWWPRSCLQDSFVRVLARYVKKMDIESKALIVGLGAKARAIVLGLLNAGYGKIYFVDVNAQKSKDLVEELKQKYFGVEFGYYKQEDLAYLPGVHSIVINTTPNVEGNQMLPDLHYFNYLNSKAVVLDLSLEQAESALMAQAKDLGLIAVSGHIIASYTDCIWAELCFSKLYGIKKFDVDEYYERFLKALRSEAVG